VEPQTVTLIWLVFGFVLIFCEFLLPGLVVSFLGLAAILVAALRWIGILEGHVESITTWFVSSVVLLLTLRHFALRWFPGESSVHSTDEDFDAIGEVVDVVSLVSSANSEGRIRFRGTTWSATTRGDKLLPGSKAKLIYRDNLVWTIEEHREEDSGGRVNQIDKVTN